MANNNLIWKIYREVVGSINANNKVCCEAAKTIIDFKICEVAHLKKSRISNPLTKAPTTKFKHEQYGMIKVQGISRMKVESWYMPRELRDSTSRFIKKIMYNVCDHVKMPEEVNAVKQLELYYS